jgi:hypothetical protein
MSTLRFTIIAIALLVAYSAEADEFRFKTFPKLTEKECHAKGGYWGVNGMPGSPRPPECNLRTSDAGKNCLSSKECEGYCLLDKKHSGFFRTVGQCSPEQILVGCQDYLQDGKRFSVCTN